MSDTIPEHMGTTGLQQWVNNSSDLYEYKERRDRAEGVISKRYGTYAAMLFVQRLCCDKQAAKHHVMKQREMWQQHLALAKSWAREIKASIIAGQPIPIKANPDYQHTLELAYDIATGQCPFASI